MTVIIPDYNTIRVVGGNTIDLPIDYASYADTFILKGADGLGPGEIDVNISNTPQQGGIFQNKVPQNKQIIMRVGLNPAWDTGQTPRQLRSTLYGLLTGGSAGDSVSVQLIKKSSAGAFVSEACRITGYVSKLEIVPFSKDPQVQITIECLSPYFEENALTSVSMVGMPLPTITVENQGNAPSGFKLKWSMAASGPLGGSFTLTLPNGKFFKLDSVPVAYSDSIEIDTRPGLRYANLIRGATVTSILGYITTDSDWLMLYSGVNTIARTGNNIGTWDSFQYRKYWWGV